MNNDFVFLICIAERNLTNEELEDMLESGNPALFTQGVSQLESYYTHGLMITYLSI